MILAEGEGNCVKGFHLALPTRIALTSQAKDAKLGLFCLYTQPPEKWPLGRSVNQMTHGDLDPDQDCIYYLVLICFTPVATMVLRVPG